MRPIFIEILKQLVRYAISPSVYQLEIIYVFKYTTSSELISQKITSTDVAFNRAVTILQTDT